MMPPAVPGWPDWLGSLHVRFTFLGEKPLSCFPVAAMAASAYGFVTPVFTVSMKPENTSLPDISTGFACPPMDEADGAAGNSVAPAPPSRRAIRLWLAVAFAISALPVRQSLNAPAAELATRARP